jgi:Flp pilus assembly protein TadG
VQRLNDERGAVAVIVLVCFTLLFGIGALVVDAGSLYQERRVLQNGADAAALAIATQCGTGTCGTPGSTAESYVDENADDGSSALEELCGSGVTGASACVDPPTVPTGAGYVRVTASTAGAGEGDDVVPPFFSRVFGHEGTTVHARSTVIWGGPSSLTSELPVTMSQCEYDHYTADGLHDPPPYTSYPSPEAVIYLHNTDETLAPPCDAGPSGADLPGGFGWLDTATDCLATSDTEGWFDDSTGVPPPSSCDPTEMDDLVGHIVHIPVFDSTNGLNGANGEYHMSGFASFFVTGYSIVGQYKVKSIVTNSFPCSGSATCISGFFVQDDEPLDGEVGGPAMGVTVIEILE